MNNNSESFFAEPATSKPSKWRSYLSFGLRAGLGVGFIAVLLHFYNAGPVFRLLGREQLSFFAGTIALYVAGQVMSSYRWQILSRLALLPGRFSEYFAYYFIGMFTNLFVPGLVGGDAARAIYLGRRYHRMADSVATVITDRCLGLASLFWFAALSIVVLQHEITLTASVRDATLAIGALVFAGWMATPIIARFGVRFNGRIGRAINRLQPFLARPLSLIPAIILSLILQASLAVCQYMLALGLGLHISLAAFMVCVPIANVLASLPITLNGLGVRETAYVVLLGMAGVGKPDAIALGLLWFASTMIGGMTGVVAFVSVKLPPASTVDESCEVSSPAQMVSTGR